VSIVMRLHPEGSVGAEAAPRTPCGKHCQRWCSTPPPASRQESSSSDTNFIKHSILLFLFLEKFTSHKNNASSGQLDFDVAAAQKRSLNIFNRFAGVSMYISDSSLAYFAYVVLRLCSPWPRIENTALRFPPRGGI
ncbi:hypothetical protein ALC56_09731, partial [Trachymyrmex septentrionalis]